MGRRRAHRPLNVLINARPVGRLEKDAGGGVSFQYDRDWLDWENAFPVSLSLPLRAPAWRGAPVAAVFDNLLPDSPAVRRRVAERTGAEGTDAYSLLEEIGRDCIGAMQFIPDGFDLDVSGRIEAEDSLFLRPGGRFELTPFYDVLTAQPAFDAKKIPHRDFRLAMAAGARPHYRIDDVLGRHFVEGAKAAGLGPALMRQVLEDIMETAEAAPDRALAAMPTDFHPEAHAAIAGALPRRLRLLETAWEALG